MYDYARTPNVGPAAGWKPHESIEETQQVLRELFLPHDDNFAMQRKDDGRVIGSIGLHEDQSRPKGLPVRMLGYVMNEKDWGQGFMHEGCMAALEYAFAELGVELMTVFHYPWNERSRRVIERLGFRPRGPAPHGRQELRRKNRGRDGLFHDPGGVFLGRAEKSPFPARRADAILECPGRPRHPGRSRRSGRPGTRVDPERSG